MNEKCIKILSDSFKLYKDALFDEDVMKNFSSIVSKAKKFAKPEMKEFVQDWETKLNEFSQVGLENELAGKKALKSKSKAAKKKVKRSQKKIEDDYSVHSDIDENDSPKDLDDEFEFDDKENMVNVRGGDVKEIKYETNEIDAPSVEVQ
jgi:condensin complex subunit 1